MTGPHLQFDTVTPVAARGLGGLIRDHFGNGPLYATIGGHGGLTNISFWGSQNMGAASFFQGALETAWNKLFRFYLRVGDKDVYPTLNHTRLYPFGFSSHCLVDKVRIDHELLLLPDALVQRVHVAKNAGNLSVQLGMLHQESISAVTSDNRKWSDLVFHPRLNAFVASCLDLNPPPRTLVKNSLSQIGRKRSPRDAPKATTWIGLGCDIPITTRCGHQARSKHYILSDTLKEKKGAFFVVFASSREDLIRRLNKLSRTVHHECDLLVQNYNQRLSMRPQIDTGNPVLNSAFMQYPEMIHHMKLPDRPGATRATLAGYFVYGWDALTPTISSPLANEAEYAADILKFFQETIHPQYGLPLQFMTNFKFALKEPFPSQCQYIAGLYHYVSITGDVAFARKVFPTCKFILDQCRRRIVKKTGLALSAAIWPDFPEAMDENGRDISSLNNSLLYQGVRAMEYLAHAIGRFKLAAECREWSRLLRSNFVKYLYDAEKGYFISSCSSTDFSPRKHYCAQAIFWITPFARELVSHAPGKIAAFMDEHLRSSKCLLTLPRWDTAWMADGNQLGSSYPTADYFYLNVHKLIGDDHGIKAWLGDVEWFWRHHTAPEAFTPETENEDEFGPDNWGGKQCQSCVTWYASLYNGLAGLDFDHEGLTLTPWGEMPIEIRGLRLRGVTVNLKISGHGSHIGTLKLNGKRMPGGLRKIAWKALKGKAATIELVRSDRAPNHPVIVRADGLRISSLLAGEGRLFARIDGDMTGEVVIQTGPTDQVRIDGQLAQYPYDHSTGTVSIPFRGVESMKLKISK
jgi:hypothetical protein